MKLDDLLDFLFFSIGIRQLDPVTRKEFETKHGCKTIPKFDSLIDFVKSECRLLEITNSIGPTSTNRQQKLDVSRTAVSSKPYNSKVLATQSDPAVQSSLDSSCKNTAPINTHTNRPPCILCKEPHNLYHCSRFLNLSVPDRHALVKKNTLCFNCLGSHRVTNCKSTRNCFCHSRHHRLLHFSSRNDNSRSSATSYTPALKSESADSSASTPAQNSTKTPSPQTSPALTTVSSPISTNKKSVVLLGTACAMIKNCNGSFTRFRLLIDCASTSSFIAQELVEKLNLNIIPCNQKFSGLSNTPVSASSGIIKCLIKPSHASHPKLSVQAFVVDNILQNVPHVNLPESSKYCLKGLQLADPEFYRSGPVHMLLGCDILPQILVPGSIPPHITDVGVLCTIFGHIIIGPLTVNNDSPLPHNNMSLLTRPDLPATSTEDNKLHELVQRFWESENLPNSPVLSPEDEFCEQHFLKTHRRDSSGRYIVQMPFRCDPSSLEFPDSKLVADQRFHSLETRFRKHPSLKNDCVKFLKEYQSLGHMEKASRAGKYFIPYFCVYNANSPTTPTRVVFDGSAKHSGTSLNDVLFTGPKLQHEVPDVLMNFRTNKFVFCCDISKMYRQILLDENQRQFVHILFREDPNKPLEEYELCTVVYGLGPSSFLSHRALIQLVNDEGHKYPKAVNIILNNSVVDDLFAGSDTLEELFEIKNQLSSILLAGCFPLNKWLSNSAEFLEQLQSSDSSGTLVIRSAEDSSIKVLGIGWHPKLDVFFFSIEPQPISASYTKRSVLSVIARIYDPLGFAAPMIFYFKHLLKEIWLSGVGWDDPISPTLSTQWTQCLSELPEICSLKIPRCLFPSEPLNISLLGFCDGSMRGSAAVLYLRVQFLHKVSIFLLKSKTRIAPSKTPTIPRLELTGAVLLAKLINSIHSFISQLPLKNISTFLFCDSTIVLSWIKKPPHLLKLFVANRVCTILEHTAISNWNHIASELNVSDSASRGLTPQAFIDNTAWFEGPEWAYHPIDSWPVNTFDPIPLENLPEVKNTSHTLVTSSTTNQPGEPPDWLCKYSSFSRLQRVTAFVLRFIQNLRSPNKRLSGSLCLRVKIF